MTRSPVDLPPRIFGQPTVWAAHVGGLCLFRGVEHPAAIAVGPLPIGRVRDPAERNGIARFLEANGLVGPIATARGGDAAAILWQTIGFILLHAADALGPDLARAARAALRRAARRDWSEARQADVAEPLARECQMDKAGTRAARFGPEPGVEEPAPEAADADLVHRVGPRGALRGPRG
ncbi:MAG: hypothetical protein N2Z62_04195 [Rhodobacteraceae bacterium]|nr:hypothetical protein [Paracoccaceae bacterium]